MNLPRDERHRIIAQLHQRSVKTFLSSSEIAHRHRLTLIEDAACAIGSELELDGRWQRVGRPHGAIACFSFHPRKVVTTGLPWYKRWWVWATAGAVVAAGLTTALLLGRTSYQQEGSLGTLGR